MTRLAFAVSEQTGAPVIILSTTAVANAITAMKVGKIEHDTQERPASFQRNLAKFTKAVPQWCRDQHADAISRLERAGELFKAAKDINLAFRPGYSDQAGRNERRGIVVAGVSYTYLQELRQSAPGDVEEIAIFKVGCPHPLPQQELRDFLKELDVVLVLEELEPIIETAVLALIAEDGLKVKVLGKRSGLLPRVGDYSVELVEQAMAEFSGRSHAAAPLTSSARQPISAQSTQNDHAAPPPR